MICVLFLQMWCLTKIEFASGLDTISWMMTKAGDDG